CACTLAALAAPALAQSYPTRPIKLLVSFPPGGASDLIARVIGAALSERLGQPIVVENRPGAHGNTAGEAAAHPAAGRHAPPRQQPQPYLQPARARSQPAPAPVRRAAAAAASARPPPPPPRSSGRRRLRPGRARPPAISLPSVNPRAGTTRRSSTPRSA